MVVINHGEHLRTIVVDGVVKLLATTTAWRQHHLIGSLQVFLVAQVARIAILAISLYGDSFLQFLGQFVELVTHLLDLLRLVVPLLNLLRVLLHLFGKVVVYSLVLLGSVHRGALQALLNNREAVEHLVRDVQCQHRHQYDVHQVDHLLARRNRSFLDCHILPLTSYI